MREIVGKGSIYTLVVLFGLNAVDELDRTAFGILVPNIRDAFGMTNTGILSLIGVVAFGSLILQVPIAIWADKGNRVRIAILGGIAWGVFSFLTGLALTVWMLIVVRTGSSLGRAVNDPVHNSLLADYYAVDVRPKVYSFHRAANALGQFVGPITAGAIVRATGDWRLPFFIFVIPTAVFVVMAFRLREPIRGAQERAAEGASEEAIETEEPAPSFAEAWRIVWKVDVLRRIWSALPFLAASLIGFVSLAALLYEEIFSLDEFQRGILAAVVEPIALVGLIVGARIGTKLILRDPALIFTFLKHVAWICSVAALLFAFAPTIWLAIVANLVITATLAILVPGLLAVLSLAIPARARSVGFSVASLFVIPGLVLLPLIGWISDTVGTRAGMAMMMPVFLLGGLMIARGGSVIDRDINDVWTAAAARSEVLYERRHGNPRQLLIRKLNVGYDGVQVLFDVDMEVDEGEIVALLGTNGAGKSTLLKAISGIVEADSGVVIFDGRDITHAPPYEIAELGILQVPGGAGVFASLTVAENLRVAGWMERRDKDLLQDGHSAVIRMFPVLGERLEEPAANLSGGQQQMLAIGMAFLSRPKLLMIDELTLGLAPVVVEQLLPVVHRIAAAGTTVLLVEQSVNIALTIAERAFFMEKGEIKFHGPTARLLEEPEILRSVFLEGADAAVAGTAEVAAAGVATGVGGDGTGGNGHVQDAGTGGAAAVAATAEPEDPSAQTPALRTIDLSRRFGGIRAVDDVSITVAPREIVGIIGPNGAGKTTLFDIISGFTRADTGRIFLAEKEITGLPPHLRAQAGLGRSFQDARLFPAMTVEEAIAVALERWIDVRDPLAAALHLPAVFDSEEKVRERVDELVELFGLGAFRSKFLRELSTGSRRIVDLACVVAHRPMLVILDEPSSGIAQRETEALAPLLLRIRDEMGAALAVIEHDMPLITTISDRLVALDQGHVVTEGDPAYVQHHPDVVESYLGSSRDLVARSGAPHDGSG
ncbi:MAG: Vitamin B12 import ATP-binding protein BtuD [Acidimicrobiales bacterium]|nr:Vitamin B12 import ATP-binding protein BtuD [Acidimicrobiales bacterium]RIK07516.1 MAG: hypothetical protein DCC48_03170 [Acidobacteriota bacterium]